MKDTYVALLGSQTLLGREIKDVFKDRGALPRLRAFSDTEAPPTSDEEDAEVVALDPLDAKAMSNAAAIILAGSAADAVKAYDIARSAPSSPFVLDCQGLLEALPEAEIVAPLISEPDLRGRQLLVVAHPAASAIALLVIKLSRHTRVTSVVANVFEPASERGKPGVSELHQQTTALLTFKPLKKEIFDTQVSFNLLPQVGEDSGLQLSAVEARIDRHIATLLGRASNGAPFPIPAVRLAQAPVFHGYSISAWVEFATEVEAQDVEGALASAQIEIRRSSEEPPDNVGAASQSGLIAGDIRVDRNHPRAVWIWIVMDNLRVVAEAAADLLRDLPKRAADTTIQ